MMSSYSADLLERDPTMRPDQGELAAEAYVIPAAETQPAPEVFFDQTGRVVAQPAIRHATVADAQGEAHAAYEQAAPVTPERPAYDDKLNYIIIANNSSVAHLREVVLIEVNGN